MWIKCLVLIIKRKSNNINTTIKHLHTFTCIYLCQCLLQCRLLYQYKYLCQLGTFYYYSPEIQRFIGRKKSLCFEQSIIIISSTWYHKLYRWYLNNYFGVVSITIGAAATQFVSPSPSYGRIFLFSFMRENLDILLHDSIFWLYRDL